MSEKKGLTRSDLVRLRREREKKQRMQRAVSEVTGPVGTVTRRDRQGITQPRRRTARSGDGRSAHNARNARSAYSNRRRFQIALLPIAPDAEWGGISLSRPQLGKRLPSFLVLALLATAIYFAFNTPQLQVAQAQVIGNQMLSPAEINASLNITGEPVFLLVPSRLETQLRRSFPEITSAKVNVSLPNAVSIHIAERKPVIRWEQGGSYTWISEDGVAFKPRGDVPGLISVVASAAPPTEGNFSPDPLTPAPFISAQMVQAIQGLGGHVPPGMTILYDPSFGLGWNDPRGWDVYFGTKADDMELKIRVYEAMVNSLTQRGIKPALIDVTYPTAPYYRMSK